MKKALIIIDWEKEWINQNSDYYIGSNLEKETQNINQLISYARQNKYRIIFVKHIELEGNSFRENDESTEFIDNLLVQKDDMIIEKNKISAFHKTNLEKVLKGIDSVLVAGILTNLCVRSAVQDAYDRDFNISIVKDCCIAMTKEIHEFTLKDLKETRPEIQIVTLSDLIKPDQN